MTHWMYNEQLKNNLGCPLMDVHFRTCDSQSHVRQVNRTEMTEEQRQKIIVRAINPLKPKLAYIIFKNSVRTAKKTPHFTITKINWSTLFKEIIVVYSEILTKPINTE
jgi:hypothetical protein